MVAAWLLPPDRCTPPNFTRSLGREGLEQGAAGGMLASVTGSAVQSMAVPVKQSTCQHQCWGSLDPLPHEPLAWQVSDVFPHPTSWPNSFKQEDMVVLLRHPDNATCHLPAGPLSVQATDHRQLEFCDAGQEM